MARSARLDPSRRRRPKRTIPSNGRVERRPAAPAAPRASRRFSLHSKKFSLRLSLFRSQKSFSSSLLPPQRPRQPLPEEHRLDRPEVRGLAERGAVGALLAREIELPARVARDLPAGDHDRLVRVENPLARVPGRRVLRVDRVEAVHGERDGDADAERVRDPERKVAAAERLDVDRASAGVLGAGRAVHEDLEAEAGGRVREGGTGGEKEEERSGARRLHDVLLRTVGPAAPPAVPVRARGSSRGGRGRPRSRKPRTTS